MAIRPLHTIRLIAASSLVGACLPAMAAAGTAEVRTYEVASRNDDTVTVARVVYKPRPGEASRLHVAFDAAGASVIDRAGVNPGKGCRRIQVEESMEVRCDFGDATSADLRVSLGDRADAASVSGVIPFDESGSAGGDIVLEGGSGPDRLDAGSAFGKLAGGAGNDVLRAPRGGVRFVGGTGNDQLTGGRASDAFVASPGRDGRDTMIGGGGSDTVSYAARRRGVRADLGGDRDDGARGERDRIARDVENLGGGAGPDRLAGSARRNRLVAGGGRDLLIGLGGNDMLDGESSKGRAANDADRLLGGAGDDSLLSGAGNDIIVGGTGTDFARGGNGNDRVHLRDGGYDEVECGKGRDQVSLDRRDWFSNVFGLPCENVRRRGAAVAIFIASEVRFRADRPAAIAPIGCPGDARRPCEGTAELVAQGRSGGTASLSLRPSRFAQVEVPLDPETWEAAKTNSRPAATLVLRVREPGDTVVRLAYRVRIE